MSFFFFGLGQVANKLFQLSYISDNIEQFATHMLQSVDSQASDVELLQCGSTEERSEGVVSFFQSFSPFSLSSMYLTMRILNIEDNLLLIVVFSVIRQ